MHLNSDHALVFLCLSIHIVNLYPFRFYAKATVQSIAKSSVWLQLSALALPLQSKIETSCPVQPRLSNQICPDPWFEWSGPLITFPFPTCPRELQTTRATLLFSWKERLDKFVFETSTAGVHKMRQLHRHSLCHWLWNHMTTFFPQNGHIRRSKITQDGRADEPTDGHDLLQRCVS